MEKFVDYIDCEVCKQKIEEINRFSAENEAFGDAATEAAKALFYRKDRKEFLERLESIRQIFGESLGGNAPAVSLYLYSIGFPSYWKEQTDKGIPQQIITDTVRDINVWISNHFEMTGTHGFSQDAWMVNHFLGELYQLGRLQFEIAEYTNPTEVWKRGEETIVLAKGGVKLEEDGDSHYEKEPVKETIYENLDGNKIRAHIVSKQTGFVSFESEMIDLSGFEQVLGENEKVLSVHIPANGKMDYELCQQSFKDAKVFFKTYFPEYSFRAFICVSWLLSNEVKMMLDPQSNIVRFSNLFTRNIAKGHYYLVHKWIFGLNVEDPLTVEPTSTLMRKTQELLKQGKKIYERGGFILI